MLNNDQEHEKIALKQALKALLTTPEEKKAVASALGVSVQAVDGWIRTGRIGKSTLAKLADLKGLDLNALVGGALKFTKHSVREVSPAYAYPSKSAQPTEPGNIATPPRTISTYSDGDPLLPGEVEVPRLTLVLSAGTGRMQWEIDEKGQPHRYQLAWCRKYGLNPQKLTTVAVSGDSMPKNAPDGSSVTIDTSVSSIHSGQIYAVDYMGDFFIKLIFKDPDGSIRLVSENEDKTRYPDIRISEENADAVRILGMAVEVKRMLISRSAW